MGLFSKKPALPNYSEMPVDQRLEDEHWKAAFSQLPDFGDLRIALNAESGFQMDEFRGVTTFAHGIVAVTPAAMHLAFVDDQHIALHSRRVDRCEVELKEDGNTIIRLGAPRDGWAFRCDDHERLAAAHLKAYREFSPELLDIYRSGQ